jgi:GMP synthase-like glutamine amidotransferase
MISLIDDISEYKVYKNALLFYFTYTDDTFKLLLTREGNENQLMPFHTPVCKYDNSPPYAIGRLMCTKYKGLFSKTNLEKLACGDELTNSDLLTKQQSAYYWDSPIFWEYLDKLSSGDYIQYDNDSKQFCYFVKIPELDVERLNKNLDCLGMPIEFSYKVIGEDTVIDPYLSGLLSQININDLLKSSLLNTNKLENNFIVLSCKPPGKSVKDQAGIFHFSALFQSLYKRANENWLYYTASTDGFPTPDVLKHTRAIIIPGSQVSVCDDHKYLRKTEIFIAEIRNKYPGIKFLGICFGAQIIAGVHGGKIQSREDGFFAGIDKLRLKKPFCSLEFIKNTDVADKQTMEVMKFHGDEITSLPKGFIHLAESDSCKYEMLVSEDENMLLIQGHPEYDCYFEFGKSIGKKLCTENIETCVVEKMKECEKHYFKKMNYWDYDMHEMRKVCYHFLKYRTGLNNINSLGKF